jgi:hypothetical protein
LARRVSVPGADELFRPTVVPDPAHVGVPPQQPGQASGQSSGQSSGQASGQASGPEPAEETFGSPAARGPSGRVRHDEKMTVYVTADELLDLEHARLTLRRTGLSVDRGRLVREAVAIALADLEANGEDSVLVHRLTQR